ncbi:hypothetical protein T492DRAFT_1152471 [Pavlovales sp. CCMP2436]|nr:hypothetical protein T492DRAFT_1152471 [Pavlovales sp. CCMP2436]
MEEARLLLSTFRSSCRESARFPQAVREQELAREHSAALLEQSIARERSSRSAREHSSRSAREHFAASRDSTPGTAGPSRSTGGGREIGGKDKGAREKSFPGDVDALHARLKAALQELANEESIEGTEGGVSRADALSLAADLAERARVEARGEKGFAERGAGEEDDEVRGGEREEQGGREREGGDGGAGSRAILFYSDGTRLGPDAREGGRGVEGGAEREAERGTESPREGGSPEEGGRPGEAGLYSPGLLNTTSELSATPALPAHSASRRGESGSLPQSGRGSRESRRELGSLLQSGSRFGASGQSASQSGSQSGRFVQCGGSETVRLFVCTYMTHTRAGLCPSALTTAAMLATAAAQSTLKKGGLAKPPGLFSAPEGLSVSSGGHRPASGLLGQSGEFPGLSGSPGNTE